MMVYLIHFDQKLKHAQHYLGYSKKDTPDDRLLVHRAGNGAKILRELNRLGIGYKIVRIWQDGNRKFERQLKNRKNSSKLCPICKLNHNERK